MNCVIESANSMPHVPLSCRVRWACEGTSPLGFLNNMDSKSPTCRAEQQRAIEASLGCLQRLSVPMCTAGTTVRSGGKVSLNGTPGFSLSVILCQLPAEQPIRLHKREGKFNLESIPP